MNSPRRECIALIHPDESARRMLRQSLEPVGYRIVEGDSGQGAILLSSQEKPDLLVVDVKLPDMSGLEVTRRLRADSATASIAVVQVTGSMLSDADRVRGLESGADAYLTSPLNESVLQATIRSLLRLKATERALRERERDLDRARQRLELLLSSITDAYFAIDRNGCIREVSSIAERLVFDRPAADLLGRRIWEDQSEEVRAPFERHWARAWEQSEPVHFETQFPGAWRWFEVHAYRRDERLEVYCRDITDRKLAEAALRESEERFRLTFQQAAVGIALGSPDGTLMAVNPGFCRILGFDGTELVGMPAIQLAPLEDRTQHIAQLSRLVRQEIDRYSTERRFLRKDGSFIWGNLTVSVTRDETGRVLFGLAVLEDINDRKLLELQREFLLESERAARTEAERSSRVKDEFVATLSHELRTPLHAITGWAQLLQRNAEMKPEAVAEGLQVVLRSARALTEMINDLLDISRIESGKLRIEMQPVDMTRVVEAAAESLRPNAEFKGVTVSVEAGPEGPVVRGDPSRLQQVVWNLLSNAIKFTDTGGLVTVRVFSRSECALVEVSDTGRGIAPEFLPHVFDRFRQQDSSTARKHQGLGLGLAIVRYLMNLHGGEVSASSAGEGQGATFALSLPLFSSDTTDRAAATSATRSVGTNGEGRVNLKQTRILIVDDEQDSRELLRRVLVEHNAEVLVAPSGEQALTLLRAHKPALLISDISMPIQDGYALMREVRALPPEEGGDIAAIALTAFARNEDRLRAIESGFQMHVSKPVDTRELLEAVAMLARTAAADSK